MIKSPHLIAQNFLLIYSLVALFVTGCGRVRNQIDRVRLECGLQQALGNDIDRIIRLKVNGSPISSEDLMKVSIGGNEKPEAITPRGCLVLGTEDKGDVALLHKDKLHAFLVDFQKSYQMSGTTQQFESYDQLNARPDASFSIFQNFCAGSSDKIYLKSPLIQVPLNFEAYSKIAGIKILATIQRANEISNSELFSSNLSLLSGKKYYDLAISDFASLETISEYEVKIHVQDLFDHKVASPSCTFVSSNDSAELLAIGKKAYFPGMYIETDSLSNLDFSLSSGIPLRELTLTYAKDNRDSKPEKIEVFVPFNIDGNKWQVIAPKPRLSGAYEVIMKIVDAAGRQMERRFSVDFGRTNYLDGGVKIAIASEDEKYMLLSNYTGVVQVIDSASSSAAFSHDVREEVAFADINENGSSIVLSLNKEALVFDLKSGKKIALETGLKNSRVKFMKGSNKIVGVSNYRTILIFNSESGKIERTIEIEKGKLSEWELHRDTATLLASTDSHHIIEVDLKNPVPHPSYLTGCERETIDAFSVSQSLEKVAFNCGQDIVIYSRSTKSSKKLYTQENGIRSIAFSPDENWVSSGTFAGEWGIHKMSGDQNFPKDKIEALEKGYNFKSSVNTISFSADSAFVGAASDDGSIHIFSVEDQDLVQSITTDGRIQQGGFLSKSRAYYAGSQDGTLRVINVKASDHTIRLLDQKIETISIQKGFLAVGTSLKTSAQSESKPGGFLFSLENHRQLARIEHDNKVNAALISSDARWLLTASEDGKAKLMSTESRNVTEIGSELRRVGAPVRSAFFAESGRKFGIISDNSAMIFSPDDTSKPSQVLTFSDWISATSFGFFDRYLVTAVADNFARIHDADTGKQLASFEAQSWIWTAKISPDRRFFANINWDNQVLVQSVVPSSDDQLNLENYLTIGIQTSGEHLTFSKDSRYLSFSLWDGGTYLVNLATKQSLFLSCLKSDYASLPVFSENGEFVAVGQDHNAIIYRTRDGKPVQLVRHTDRVTSVGFSGSSFVSGGWDGKIKINAIDQSQKAKCSSAK